MSLTEEQRTGLDMALTEADVLGLEVDPERRVAAATFRVLTLPESGPPPEDRRFQFLFMPVGRIAASLRNGRWDDPDAELVPFTVEQLLDTVQSFGGLPTYGRECVDIHAKELENWGDRLSLDWSSGNDGLAHSISVFQDAEDRILDLCLWFDDLEIRDAQGRLIQVDQFIAAGCRWWDAFNAGDERTKGHGMYRLEDWAALHGDATDRPSADC